MAATPPLSNLDPRAVGALRFPAMALLCLGLCACAPYRSTSVLAGGPGDRSFECLDLSIAPHHDDLVHAHGWIAIAYEFGNPCRLETDLDLGAAEVWVRTPTGRVQVRPHDPRGEIRAGLLDGGRRGREVIAYHAGGARVGDELSEVCVGIAAVSSEVQRSSEPSTHCFVWGPSPDETPVWGKGS